MQQKKKRQTRVFPCMTVLLQPWLLRSKALRGGGDGAAAAGGGGAHRFRRWWRKSMQTARFKAADALIDYCYLPQLNAFRCASRQSSLTIMITLGHHNRN